MKGEYFFTYEYITTLKVNNIIDISQVRLQHLPLFDYKLKEKLIILSKLSLLLENISFLFYVIYLYRKVYRLEIQHLAQCQQFQYCIWISNSYVVTEWEKLCAVGFTRAIAFQVILNKILEVSILITLGLS